MIKPKIGLSMLYCLNEPFTSLVNYLHQIDVKYVELADEGLHTLNKKRVKKLKEIAETHNLTFVVHAPWAGLNIATPSLSLRRAVIKRLEQSIEYARKLECYLWLFHPGSKTGLSHIYPGKDWQLNLHSVRTLLKTSRRQGVKIAIENTPEPFPSLMKSVADFHRFYKDLKDDVGIVLDIAHANLNNQIQDFLEQFSKRIIHIHASDNKGDFDMHLGIGHGNIDWKNITNLIKETGYRNLIIVESTDHIKESLNLLRNFFI
jgi:sugar phosphate isomerase/epimerase